jgi:hypothetical protein
MATRVSAKRIKNDAARFRFLPPSEVRHAKRKAKGRARSRDKKEPALKNRDPVYKRTTLSGKNIAAQRNSVYRAGVDGSLKFWKMDPARLLIFTVF